MTLSNACTAFAGVHRIAAGHPADVAVAVKLEIESDTAISILVFDDDTGQPIDFDLRGSEEAVRARIAVAPAAAAAPGNEAPRGRGRPKLGVVPREVTLLPRHWEWLATQPGGASVALRKLVEAARGANRGPDQIRRAQEAAGRVMLALAGDLAGYEDATRALYARHKGRFDELVQPWPADVRDHVSKLAAPVFA